MTTRFRVPKRSSSSRALPGSPPISGRSELHVESSAFRANERIPVVHTGDGQNIPPPLTWTGVPKEARSLALLCEDPDAPGSQPFVHWLWANIEPTQESTAMGSGAGSPSGMVEGKNGFGRLGYGGPEPPRGNGSHHYHFRLYALDSPLRLTEGFSKVDFLGAIKGHILATGEVIGTYSR